MKRILLLGLILTTSLAVRANTVSISEPTPVVRQIIDISINDTVCSVYPEIEIHYSAHVYCQVSFDSLGLNFSEQVSVLSVKANEVNDAYVDIDRKLILVGAKLGDYSRANFIEDLSKNAVSVKLIYQGPQLNQH